MPVDTKQHKLYQTEKYNLHRIYQTAIAIDTKQYKLCQTEKYNFHKILLTLCLYVCARVRSVSNVHTINLLKCYSHVCQCFQSNMKVEFRQSRDAEGLDNSIES